MSETLHASLLFLINTLFDLYLFVLIIRLILVWLGFNYFDPITQVIVKLTDPVIKPVKRILPNIKSIELSTIAVILLLQLIKFSLIASLSFGTPAIGGLILLSAADSLKLLLQVFFYAILLQAIISWVQPNAPVSGFLYRFTSPVMRPVQRIVPPVGGIDISPIPALILLQLLIIAFINPLTTLGLSLAIG